ncbi:MAG: HD domain-containing protein [Candidatus Caenarcaniphilales bacterium]|nr:HD domain-containing protein [Candidatus Caenarcaniphilales bacterium]
MSVQLTLESKIHEQIPSELLRIFENTNSYLVGGLIRDFVHNNCEELLTKDFDFVVFNCPDLAAFSRNIADETDSSFIELDSETQSYRIVNDKWQVDIVAPRGRDIEEDLEERDFSINAVAYELSSKKILDPQKGLEDLEQKVIRGIQEKNFKDDPLRCIRSFRIAAQLSNPNEKFKIDSETKLWIQNASRDLHKVASERISHEIWLLMSSPVSFDFLWLCAEMGIWERIYPEFTDLRKVPSNTHHHLPLFEHTFELVKQYEANVRNKLPESCLNFIKREAFGNVTCEALVKMSCLLHDISKPETWQIEGEKHSFHKHEKLGAEVTKLIGKRMKWSKTVTNSVSLLVNFHLRPFQLSQKGQEPSPKAERKFFRQIGDLFYPLVCLAWADLLSTRGPKVSEQDVANNEIMLKSLCEKYRELSQKEQITPPLLSGTKLEEAIEVSTLPPTKIIKELLNELRDLQMSGDLETSEQAFQWFISKGQKLSQGKSL